MLTAGEKTKDFKNLIERLQNGDVSAFDEIYKSCSAPIAFLCQKFCDNKEDAEEVVQDTFVIAYKKAADLRADTLMAYLRKIAIHECFRKRDKNSLYYQFSADSDNIAEDIPELNANFLPQEYLQNKETYSELLRTINKLPKNRREMIYLYYFAEINTEEIASIYGVSASTVRNTLAAARNEIRAKLESIDKAYMAKGMAVLPISALFLIEEQAFAAAYVPLETPSVANVQAVSGTVKTVAKQAKFYYIVAACVVAVGIVSAVLFTALRQSPDDYVPYEPERLSYEVSQVIPEDDFEVYVEEAVPYVPVVDEAEQVELPAEDIGFPAIESEPEPEPELPVVDDAHIVSDVESELAPEQPEQPGSPVEDDVIELEPEVEPDEEELPVEDDVVEPELEPEPIDRTPEILAELADAVSSNDAYGIIRHYGFVFERQIRTSDDLVIRFYVTDEGSGDILIGMAAYEDGTAWRMRFEHFSGGTMPRDIMDLFRFME